ncbi:MAG: hypothetical protein KDA22_05405 [Phycisphaerales bacterium]|nr:hypothetical protein [Phycisphaerales bacterium]
MARRKRSNARGSDATPTLDRVVLVRAGGAFAWTLLVIGLAAGWILGLPWLTARAAAQAESATQHVAFRELPPWLEAQDRAFLNAVVVHNAGVDPLDRRGLVQTRQALLDTGWFDSVSQVRRTAPDRIEIDAVFVTPFALVRDKDGDHLVDREGRLLPRSYPLGEGPAVWVLLNPSFERPRNFGTPWTGAEVSGAIAVLKLLEDRPWAKQVHGVDLSEFPRSHQLRLLTDRSTVVIWGRTPGAERGAEVPAAKKLKYLDYHYQQYGHIDGGRAGALDVTTDVAFER